MTINECIDRIATRILDAAPELDHIDFMHDLRDLLAPSIHRDLCFALELCPIHILDDRICADDDDPECAHLRD